MYVLVHVQLTGENVDTILQHTPHGHQVVQIEREVAHETRERVAY